jgi:cysteine desulfuration protein SufE
MIMSDMLSIQNELVDEFAMFDDWMDKYEYIIELGKDLPLINETYKTEDKLIKGCQSSVWLHACLEQDKVIFTADSDAIITKGIIAIMIRVLSNQSPIAILDTDLAFIDNIGLKEHLSSTRSNGLVSMIKQMKMYALVFKSQQSN